MKHKNFIKVLTSILIVLIMTFMIGCGDKKPSATDGNSIQPNQKPEMVKATLYFPDSNAEFLVPVEVEIPKGTESLEKMILEALIKGPGKEDLGRALPIETKILSITKENDTAYVDFSREIETKHWGGSTGETFTIYAVVNSLTELEDISKVQFLIEGSKDESIAGHYALNEPFERNEQLIKKAE